MWARVRLFLHRVLPMRLRVYLLERDLRTLDDPPLPPASDVTWVDCDEELEAELYNASKRRRFRA